MESRVCGAGIGFWVAGKGFWALGERGFCVGNAGGLGRRVDAVLVLGGEGLVLEMNGGWGKEILCNRVSLGMIGKSLLSIAVKGAGFAVVNTRHVPHMFYDLGQ